MKPPEEVARGLARDWLAKAATDLRVCEQLLGQGAVFSETSSVSSISSPSVTHRSQKPSLMSRSSRHMAWSIAIQGNTRLSRRKPLSRACRWRARSTTRWLAACQKPFDGIDAGDTAAGCEGPSFAADRLPVQRRLKDAIVEAAARPHPH